jgi:hypothetical protein
VLVLVTGQALGAKAQKGPHGILALVTQLSRIEHVVGAMTLAALERLVSALESMAGQFMIESGLPFVSPPDELELQSVMIDVTGLAIGILGPGMKTAGRLDALRDQRVARETLLGIHALAGLVALEAAGAPLEVFVWFAELSGRELSGGRRGHGRQQSDHPPSPGTHPARRAPHPPHET